MPESLYVSGVNFREWGGASGVQLSDIPPGLTVILGDNEVGKSSMASGLALLLMGGGTAVDFSLFGEATDRLTAELTGRLGPSDLRVDLQTMLTKHTGKQAQNSNRRCQLGGVELAEEAFNSMIGEIGLDGYRAHHCLNAESIHLESETPDGKLSARHVFGGIEPFVEASSLQKGADRAIGKTKASPDSARQFIRQAESIRTRLQAAREAGGDVDHHIGRLDKIDKKITNLKDDETKSGRVIQDLTAALNSLPLHSTLRSLQDPETRPAEPSDVDRELAAARDRITSAIQNLETACSVTETASNAVDQAHDQAGDWAELRNELDTTEQRSRDLDDADAEVRSRRSALDKAREAMAIAGTAPGPTPVSSRRQFGTTVSVTTGLLALGAVVATLLDQSTTAQVFVLGAALSAVSLALLRVRSREGTIPTTATDVSGAQSRLESAIEERTEILVEVGLPVDQAPRILDGTGHRLRLVAELKKAVSDHEKASSREQDRMEELSDLLPPGAESRRAGSILDLACQNVDLYTKYQTSVQEAREKLTQSLGGTQTEANRLLDQHDKGELEEKLRKEQDKIADLKEQIVQQGKEADTARIDRSDAEVRADTEKLEIEMAAVRGRIRAKLVDGLAHRLAAQILTDSAEQYLGDNSPEILRRAEDHATQIAGDWHGLALDRDRETGIRILSSRGNHGNEKLSLGGRSGLNLSLRLATVETESAKLPFRLPLLLDDPLIHLDDTRRQRAFQIISRLAKDHQVLYFTCHGQHAEEAQTVDAHLVELRGSGPQE